jgi:hypothetical protein
MRRQLKLEWSRPEETPPGRLAAVDEARRTRDERRLIGRKEHDSLADLFGSSDSIEWHARRQTRLSFGSTSAAMQQPSIDGTRGDHVYAYARRGGFKRSRLGQPFDRACWLNK